MKSRMRVAMIVSECVPYAKTGGLADVAGALPKALKRLGHDVIVIMPKYRQIDAIRFGMRRFLSPLGVWMGNAEEWCAVYSAHNDGVQVFFIESDKYFGRDGLYHDANYWDYPDNPRRFAFFTRAALQFCHDSGFSPDIIHVHDWQTALAAAYLKIWHWNDPFLGNASSVLTIHNLAYQGVYGAEHYDYLGLQWGNFTAQKLEDHGRINFLKGGIHYADLVNAVSPKYAAETRTPEGGYGLAPYLNDKGASYVGILNGADYDLWNPATDILIPEKYDAADLAGKAVCKRDLQQRFHLTTLPGVPVIGVVSRLAAQKGLDLLKQTIENIVTNMHVQFVILGSGEKELEAYFGELPGRYPGRVGSYIGYSDELAHWIYAGSDFFLMPSIYEPCGLGQMYALKYGALPVVRATGGLDDTVEQYDEQTGEGTGFKYWDSNTAALYYTIGWAVSAYYDRPQHIRQMVQAAMGRDFSWQRSAKAYVQAYAQAMKNKMALS